MPQRDSNPAPTSPLIRAFRRKRSPRWGTDGGTLRHGSLYHDSSGRLRAVQVDDERPFSDERDDELLRLVERVHVPVDEPDGHVEETALLHLRALRAAWPEFEAEATPDDVPKHFAISVVMPTRDHTAVDTTADVERAIRRECDLPDDAGRRVALRQAVWCNRRDSII